MLRRLLIIFILMGLLSSASAGAVSQEQVGFLLGNPYLIADVAERVGPAVVYISVTFPAQTDRSPFSDPFFRQFFERWEWFFPQPPSERMSQGTGFIIDENGHVLTNQHVVGDVGAGQTIKVKITTPDYSGEVDAQLIGADYKLDLAVLKIEKPKGLDSLPMVVLGNSAQSRPGEWVIAIGNPYGEELEHTVTVGVLSAKGRRIQIADRERGQYRVYENLMQTDAAINPGNSGGPLVNIKGEVIGINTAVQMAAQGIGFAIPINVAKEVVNDLITKGKVEREERPIPWIGIYYQNIDQNLADFLRLSSTEGVVVAGVIPGSPAESAGLRVYDVITQLNDKPIRQTEDFRQGVLELSPGDRIVLQVYRRGQKMLIPLRVGQRPEDF